MAIPTLQVGVPVSFYAGTQFAHVIGTYGLSFPAGATMYDSTFAAPYVGGGSGTYGFSGGSTLPPGLTLDASTGLVSGTPTTEGTYYTYFTSVPSGVPLSGTWSGGTGGGTPPSPLCGGLTVGEGTGITWVGVPWTVTKTDQSITGIPSIPDKCYGSGFSGNIFTIASPTATSGLPVAITIQSGPATISSNTITLTGTGTVVVAFDQAGNSTYNAAPEQTISFQSIAPSLTISNLIQPFTGAQLPVTITTNPTGLAVAVTYNSTSTPPTAPGSYVIAAAITDSSSPSGITSGGTLTILDEISGSPFQLPCAVLMVNLDSCSVTTTPASLLFKKGDDIVICVKFSHADLVPVAAVASGLLLQISEEANGEIILQSDSWISGIDSGSKPYYLIHIPASGAGLFAAILDNYADAGSTAALFARLFWNASNTYGVGPSLLRQATPIFGLSIGNNLQ